MPAVLAFFAGPIGRWLVVAALLASMAFAAGVHERNIGYKEGLDVSEKRLADQAKANAAAVSALDAKYRKSEQDHKAALAAVGATYEKNLAAAKTRRDRDMADARSGSLRLSIPASCAGADGSATSAAGAAPGGGNGPARTELPREVTANLLALANDADDLARQLAACQQVIQSDRSIPPTKGAAP